MIRQEKKDLKSILQLKKQKNRAINYQSLSANTKNLLKRIKINMTKKKNREDIKNMIYQNKILISLNKILINLNIKNQI